MTDSAQEAEMALTDGEVSRPEDAPGQADTIGLGERLRSARKAKALSLERVAESLHLDTAVVLALEDEQFESLGAPVFVRGHLRAYARLLGLPADSVINTYHASYPNSLAIPSVPRSIGRSVTINPVMWGFWGLLILLGLILGWYVFQDDEAQSTAPAPRSTVAVAGPDATVVDTTRMGAQLAEPDEAAPLVADAEPVVIVSEVDEAVAEASAAESSVGEPAQAVATSQAEVSQSGNQLRLSLNFREESWVEISDANGRLLFGLQRQGRRRELAGEPPLLLVIGNAAGVDLSVNDEPYPMPSAGRTGQVARFEIRGPAR